VRAAGPVVDPVPCSGCSKLIDPLRAGHVAIFDLRFHFFCGRACRARFLGEAPLPPAAVTMGATPPYPRSGLAVPRPPTARRELDAPILPAESPAPDPDLPEPPPREDDPSLVEPIAQTILNEEPSRLEAPEARDVGALLLVMAVVAGALAVALTLAGDA